MKNVIGNIFVTAVLLFIALFFVFEIWSVPYIAYLLSMAGLIIFCTAIPFSNIKILVLPGIIVFFTMVLLFNSDSSPLILWEGFREMRAVVPIVVLVSILGWIVGYKPYVQNLLKLGKGKIRTYFHMYMLSTGMTHFISSFMGMGGIAFVYHLFNSEGKTSSNKLAWDFTMSTAIMRGFSLTAVWAAVHPAFAFAITGIGAPLFSTMLKGLGLALIGLILGVATYYFQFRKMNIDPVFNINQKQMEEKIDGGLVREFFFWLVLLLSSIFFFYQVVNIEILIVVPCVVVIMSILYYAWNQNLSKYKALWKHMCAVEMKSKKKDLLLIFSAGLLVSTLRQTGLGETFFQLFLETVEWMHLDLLIGLTIIIMVLGFIGLPPIPAAILLSGILFDIPPGYSPEVITLSLLLGVSITIIIAPVTVPMMLMSSQNGRSVLQNGFRWNIVFGIILLVFGLAYIQLLN